LEIKSNNPAKKKKICLDLPSKKLTSSLAGSDASTILAVPSMKLTVPLALWGCTEKIY